MSKHTSWKTKYHYIMRYKNVESKWTIVNELVERGLIKRSKKQKNWNHTFNNWLHAYEKNGVEGLVSESGGEATGRPLQKKRRNGPPAPEELTRERLEWVYRRWSNKEWPKDNDEIYDIIDEELESKDHSFTKIFLCWFFGITPQGMNKARRLKSKSKGKLNQDWSELIEVAFYKKREKYGYRRIYVELCRMGYKISLGTVKNYMRALGLKSNIRVKRNTIQL